MISEVDNIIKGRVVKTVEFDSDKKIIGIAESTVKSQDGISPAPLAKQTAFTVVQDERIQQAAAKVLGSDIPDAAAVPIAPADPLQEPKESDITQDSSVTLENPGALGSIAISGMGASVEGDKPLAPTGLDQIADAVTSRLESALAPDQTQAIPEGVELPENHEDVVGLEPAVTTDALFASNEVAEEKAPLVEPAAVVLENPALQGANGEAQTIDVTAQTLNGEDTSKYGELPEVEAPELPSLDTQEKQEESTEVAQEQTISSDSALSNIEKYNKMVAEEMAQAILGVMNKHIDNMIAMKMNEAMMNQNAGMEETSMHL